MRYIVLFILVLSFSCKPKDNVPHNLIPKDKMIDILVDIHMLDGMFTNTEVRKQFAQLDSANYYNVIFENHGYSRQDFDTSVYYYSHNINDYDKIYIEVLNRLSQLETIVKEETQEQTPKVE
ncbi:MAG: hypothetical protein A2W99_11555 [Bacteroidetes bacterium GWF2_33_16]|nr:MAG: hypothetical protein A2X00_04185 [Bacteroidetes bacterium GWE2_32_14]OFY04162.1 MAG: hypothetical protein A2W99_11555 [Bacteroidetes bacterium GWF2_33_16]